MVFRSTAINEMIIYLQVECKKAQPKETVASLNVLAKRMVLPMSAASTLAQGIPRFQLAFNFLWL